MKKLFKALLAVMIAVIMSFAIVAFAGCDTNPDDPDKRPEEPVNPSTFEIEGSTPEITELLKAMLEQKTEYMGLTYTMNGNSNTDRYHVNESGNKKNDGYSDDSEDTESISASAKINAVTGNGDISSHDKNTYKYSSSATPSVSEHYEYIFLRDWNIFMATGMDKTNGKPAPITNFTGETLNWAGDINDMYEIGVAETGYGDMITGAIEEMFGELNIGSIASTILLPYYGFMPAMVADSLGAFSINEDKTQATADMNLAIYNLVQKVKTALNTVNDNTTVGDLLAMDDVKSLITTYTATVKADDVKSMLDLAIETVSGIQLEGGMTIGEMLEAMNLDIASYIVAPDANSTVYDYIVKIVSSNELTNLLDVALGMLTGGEEGGAVITMPTTLNNVKLSFFLNLLGTSVSDIKELVNDFTENITATDFNFTVKKSTYEIGYWYYDEELGEEVEDVYTLNIPTSLNVSVKNVKMVYELDGNTVKSISINNFGYTSTETGLSVSYHTEDNNFVLGDITKRESSSSASMTMKLDLPTAAYTLTDINANDTIHSQYEWTDKTNGKYSNLYIYPSELGINGNSARVTATISVANGKVTGVTYKDEDGKALTVKGNALTVNIYDYDKEEEVPVTVYVYTSEDNYSYEIYVTAEPVTGAVNYNNSIAYTSISKDTVYYGNTVSGILSGAPSSKLQMGN